MCTHGFNFVMGTGRVPRDLKWGKQCISVVVRVMYVHVGIPIYLGNTKESEVECSTATGVSEKNRNILCVFLCVP
jgi:hypothetical protein